MLYVGIGLLLAAVIGMVAWFWPRTSQAPPSGSAWTPVSVPPDSLISFVDALWSGPLAKASPAFILKAIRSGWTIHEATCEYLAAVQIGDEDPETSAEVAK